MELRHHRDVLLRESDWTALDDVSLSEQKKSEWKVYRQKLRDLTATYPEPPACGKGLLDWAKITLPTEPE
jgi:hypothetical protein